MNLKLNEQDVQNLVSFLMRCELKGSESLFHALLIGKLQQALESVEQPKEEVKKKK